MDSRSAAFPPAMMKPRDRPGSPGRAAILTGERGAGKTTLCLLLARTLPDVGGIVCPAVFDQSGNKTGFHCLCLQSGTSWQLGTVKAPEDTTGDPKTGKYRFSPAGIQRGIECIRNSLQSWRGITVIDEIGPLELVQNGGFAAALSLLADAGNLLLVVRSAFVEEIVPYISGHRTRVFSVTEANRATLGDEVSGFFA